MRSQNGHKIRGN